MNFDKHRAQGFTLIELMMVVGIIALLAAIAYPSYTKQVQETREGEIKGEMTSFVTALESYRAQNFSYQNADGVLTEPSNAFYTVTLTVDGDFRGYNLLATPIGSQTGAGALKINEAGQTCHLSSSDSDCTIGTDPEW